ncbi:MAG TPA: RidA family protein [Chloroflexota bacterium]|jgi:enamine deaminase RidA (YjgF/YER057c/UK114 family)
MPIERIQPPGLPESTLYSPVVRTGNVIYVAGQVAQDERGEVVGRGDFGAQAAQVMANLEKALAAAGAGLEHLVRITIYITDARYRDLMRDVTRQYLGAALPASTLLVVAGLARPEYLLEIDGIAVVD